MLEWLWKRKKPAPKPHTGRVTLGTGWIEYKDGVATDAFVPYSGPEVIAGDPIPDATAPGVAPGSCWYGDAVAVAADRGLLIPVPPGPFDAFCDRCGKRGICRIEGTSFRCGCTGPAVTPGGAAPTVAGDPVFTGVATEPPGTCGFRISATGYPIWDRIPKLGRDPETTNRGSDPDATVAIATCCL